MLGILFIGFQALGSVKDTQAKEYRKLKREMASRNDSNINEQFLDSDSSTSHIDEKDGSKDADIKAQNKSLLLKKAKSSAPGLQKSRERK